VRLSLPGLTQNKKNGTFGFRRAVPPHLREIAKKTEWKVSLRLQSHQRAAAVQIVERIWRETDQLIQQFEAQLRAESSDAQSPLEHYKAATAWAADHNLLAGMRGREDHSETHQGRDYHFPSDADIAFECIVAEAQREFGFNQSGQPQKLTPQQEAQLAILATGKPVAPC
jgi:uncharacterized protein DUF6538